MSKNEGVVVAIVGGQFGSEGKGVIVAHLANLFNVHVRTGGPNAGHSFVYKGKLYAMQSLPCGWINPNAVLVIGAGGLIDIDQLTKEIDMVMKIDPSIINRLSIDKNCGVVSDWHKKEEGGTEGEMHKRIGSTGKGVGAARRDRIMREPDKFKLMGEFSKLGSEEGHNWTFKDILVDSVAESIEFFRYNGENILLEGTQGSGLSLIHSYWPYATSQDTNAAQLCADAGIAPTNLTRTILVCRTYPIRVVGNSGPMVNETDWEHISERVGRPIVEITTVTKKIRRIGKWDESLVEKSILLNDPEYLAITFMDYLAPETEGVNRQEALSERAHAFIHYLEVYYGVKVGFVGTGGEGFQIVDLIDKYDVIKRR